MFKSFDGNKTQKIINATESINNPDYLNFLNKEFPNPKGKYPNIERSLNHLDKISKGLLDCARQIHGQAEEDKSISPLYVNTRTIIVSNFRIRIISLIKIFNDIIDARGDSIFDQGTANVIVRSLLESYLVYYKLYNSCEGDQDMRELYFDLYDLASILHLIKYQKSIPVGIPQDMTIDNSLNKRIEALIKRIKNGTKFQKLPLKIREAILRIEAGTQDFLSFINFSRLIRACPLPTELITAYYSYASSFAHSEAFSADITQVYFQSGAQRQSINEMLKFRLAYICLAVCSQFFKSFNDYSAVAMDLKKDEKMLEAIWLSNYYLTAVNHNQ